MKKGIFKTALAIIVIIILYIGFFSWKNLRGIGPALKNPPEDITKTINTTGMPLLLPKGFSIEIFAKNLPGARAIKQDIKGKRVKLIG